MTRMDGCVSMDEERIYKCAEMAEGERPALCPDMKITPEMIEAGQTEACLWMDMYISDECLSAIFRAMMAARHDGK